MLRHQYTIMYFISTQYTMRISLRRIAYNPDWWVGEHGIKRNFAYAFWLLRDYSHQF